MKENILLHKLKIGDWGTSLGIQGLRTCAFNAGDMGSIPGPGIRILPTTSYSKKKKKMIIE